MKMVIIKTDHICLRQVVPFEFFFSTANCYVKPQADILMRSFSTLKHPRYSTKFGRMWRLSNVWANQLPGKDVTGRRCWLRWGDSCGVSDHRIFGTVVYHSATKRKVIFDVPRTIYFLAGPSCWLLNTMVHIEGPWKQKSGTAYLQLPYFCSTSNIWIIKM